MSSGANLTPQGGGAATPPGATTTGTSRLPARLAALVPGFGAIRSGRYLLGASMAVFFAALGTLLVWRWERVWPSLAVLWGGAPREARQWSLLLAAFTLVAMLVLLALLNARLATAPVRSGRQVGISEWSIVRKRFIRNRVATAGLLLLTVLYLLAVLAPLIANFDPTEQIELTRNRLQAPNGVHWLGTDEYARDVFSRLVFGARISLFIGFVAVALSVSIGSLYGAVAGYFGGVVDTVLMRIVDMLLSFPRLVLLIAISALFETRSLLLIMIILGFTGWMGVARIVRGQVLSLKEQDFIQAARALGMGSRRIILRHLLPNAMAPVIVASTLAIGGTILVEAALSFLGLGVPPPTATWGAMVNEGRQHIDFESAYWISTYPGLMIVFAVVCFNLLGDGLRDALDPRLRGT